MTGVVVEVVPEDEEYWRGVAERLLVDCGGVKCVRGSGVRYEDVRRLVLHALLRGVEDVSELARLVSDSFGLEWRVAVEAVLLVLSDYQP